MATSAAAGIGEVEMCKFCGDEPVARVCTAPACARKQLCVNCDEIWHGHPSRRSHQRQEVDALLRENGRSDQPLTQPQQQGYPWSCPHCTFQNVSAVQWKPEDRLMCEVCSKTSVGRELREAAPAQTSNSNTTKTKKSTKKSSPSTEIACPTCTFVNTAKGAKQCEMCNSQLPSPSKKRENPAAASPNAENSIGLNDLSPQERQRQFQAQAAIGRQNAGRSNQGDQQPPSQSDSESHRKQAHASAVEDRVEQKRQRTQPPSENRAAAVETSANSLRKETRAFSRSDVVPAGIATESKQLEDAEYPLYQQQLEEKELQVQLAELLAVQEAEKRQFTQAQLQEREQLIQELQTRLKEEQEQRLRTERRFKKEATERQRLELAMLEQQRLEREKREELERQARIKDENRRQREGEEMRQRKRREEAERKKKEKEEAERFRKEREEAERLRQQREEAERLRKEREEADRLRQQREEADRLRQQREEAEWLKQQREEADRLRQQREEADRLRKEREEAERWRKEREEAERLRKETEEAQRLWKREEAERQRRNQSLRNASAAVGRWERAEEERLRQDQEAEAMQNDLQLIRKTRLQRGKQVPLDENPRKYQGDEARQRRADDTTWQMEAVTHASGLQFGADAISFPSRARSSATVSSRRVEDSESVDAAEKLLNGIYGPETSVNDLHKVNTSDESDEFDEPKKSSTRVTGRMKAQKAETKLQCAHCGKYRAITGPIKPVGFQCFNCYKHTCKMCGRPWEDVHTGRKCKELDSLPGVAPSPKRGSVSRPGSAQIQVMRCTRCRVHVDTNLKRDSSNVMCRNCGNILHLPRPY